MTKPCPICGEPIEPDGEWPVEHEGTVLPACLTCWEAECDELWWLVMTEMGAL